MKIVWVPLPKTRLPDGRLQLSVFASPRLDLPGGAGDGLLSDVDRMVDWPDYVNALDIGVSFDGNAAVPTDKDKVDPKWWQKLFSPDTPLQAHELPDHSKTLIHTFPVQNILEFIEGTYKQVAEASPTDAPPAAWVSGLVDQLRPVTNVREFFPAYENTLTKTGARALYPGQQIAGLSSISSDFLQAHRFYRRLEQEASEDNKTAPDRPERPKPEFHRMLAYLADSPELMRHMGLIVDLTFDDPGVPATGTVRVELSAIDPSVDLRPSMRYQMWDNHFLAAPRKESFVEEGTLHLDWVGELFDFYQMDIDGGSMKLLDFSATAPETYGLHELAAADPGTATLPSLRSGGFTVSARGRALRMVSALDDATGLNTDVESDNAELGLEDVHRGWRLDVHEAEAGAWRPLQSRVGTFSFLGIAGYSSPDTLGPIGDEGFVRASAASSTRVDVTNPADPNQPGKPDLYLHEAIFGWDGWSHAAPRPGKIVVEPYEGEEDGDGEKTHLASEQLEAEPELPVVSRYRVAERTLPRLRFGHTYRMRARAVDIAGNGLGETAEDLDDRVTPERRYLRYEPVASPVVVRRHPDTEGESLERMVIRSDLDLTPAQYVATAEVISATAGAVYQYTDDSQRHIAPPKAAVQTVELHGLLDGAFGNAGDPGTAYRLALKEEGTFVDRVVVDPSTGGKDIDVSGDIHYVNPTGAPIDDKRGAGLPQGVYLYRPGPQPTLPYLPDPLAKGAAFFDLPGLTGSSLKVPYDDGSEWWDVLPFRVRLVGIKKGDGPPTAKVVDGELVVTLPQAEQIRCRVSSSLDKGGRGVMAIWDLISDAARQALEVDSLEGRMWMLTPFRYLEFVHAVQRPLELPVVAFLPHRALGASYTGFSGTVDNHAKSTGRLDVNARWRDPIDSGATGDLPLDGKDGRPLPDEKQAVAFGWEIAAHEDKALVNRSAAANSGNERSSRHEFGDTKHRLVRYTPVATTRFREYFAPALTDEPESIQRIGAEVELDVPSSARPAPPKVLYAIPTFGWDEEVTPTSTRKTRKGGGLRVYMERPWYSSGEGELLGVVTLRPPRRVRPDLVIAGEAVAVERVGGVLHTARMTSAEVGVIAELPYVMALDALAASAQPFVTTWGRDPVWASLDPKPIALHTDFSRRTKASRSGLSIMEAPGATVAVAAHEVSYDPDRELWYSDIEVAAGHSYFPFIRLALARFQPSSLDGAHLSPVVITDFAQLIADRTATVSVSGSQATVTVSGVTAYNIMATGISPFSPLPPGAPDPTRSRKLTVTLQSRAAGSKSDLAWNDDSETYLNPVKRRGLVTKKLTETWSGKISIPEGVAGLGTHRLLIQEHEFFATDADLDIHPQVSHYYRLYSRSRVVYVDTFDI
jgi:hypothetical protein